MRTAIAGPPADPFAQLRALLWWLLFSRIREAAAALVAPRTLGGPMPDGSSIDAKIARARRVLEVAREVDDLEAILLMEDRVAFYEQLRAGIRGEEPVGAALGRLLAAIDEVLEAEKRTRGATRETFGERLRPFRLAIAELDLARERWRYVQPATRRSIEGSGQ